MASRVVFVCLAGCLACVDCGDTRVTGEGGAHALGRALSARPGIDEGPGAEESAQAYYGNAYYQDHTTYEALEAPRDALGRFTSPKAPTKATAPLFGSAGSVKTASTDQPRDAKGRFTKKTAAARSLTSDFDKAATSDDGIGMAVLLGLGAAAAMYAALS